MEGIAYYAALSAIARAQMPDQRGSYNSFSMNLRDLCIKISGRLEMDVRKSSSTVHQNIIYSLKELSEDREHSAKTLSDCIEYGLVKGDSKEGIRGDRFNEFSNNFSGLVSLRDFLSKQFKSEEISFKKDRIHRILSGLEPHRYTPYFWSYQLPGSSPEGFSSDEVLYFLESSCSEKMKDFFNETDLRINNPCSVREKFVEITGKTYTTNDFRELTLLHPELDAAKLIRVLRSASDIPYTSLTKSEDPLNHPFSYRNFLFGYQSLRGNQPAMIKSREHALLTEGLVD